MAIDTLIEQFATLASGIPLGLGVASYFSLGFRRPRHLTPGLLFHSVVPHPPVSSLSYYSSEKFESFVRLLKSRGYGALPLRNTPFETISGKTLVITFDDGFRNFYRHAMPVLENYGMKATIFPVAGFLAKRSSWDVGTGEVHLTKDELRAISGAGHEIGSHTLTHANLPYLSGSQLDHELLDSKHRLEDIIGIPVTSISFPHGFWNREVWKRARELGYIRGTTYRDHRMAAEGLLPVFGAYRFDSPMDLLARVSQKYPLSLSCACARIMAHFSKGTPVWKFRRKYIRISQF